MRTGTCGERKKSGGILSCPSGAGRRGDKGARNSSSVNKKGGEKREGRKDTKETLKKGQEGAG